MLGAAGVLFPELLKGAGLGGPAAATPWYEAGAFEYSIGSAKSLFAVQMLLFAFVEVRGSEGPNGRTTTAAARITRAARSTAAPLQRDPLSLSRARMTHSSSLSPPIKQPTTNQQNTQKTNQPNKTKKQKQTQNNPAVFLLFPPSVHTQFRRLQDIRKPGSASQDPFFASNRLPAGEVGYPGGIFDPLGYSRGGDLAALKLKEIKNGRLVSFSQASALQRDG